MYYNKFLRLFSIFIFFLFVILSFANSNVIDKVKYYTLRYNLQKGEHFLYKVKSTQQITIMGQIQPMAKTYQLALNVDDALLDGNYIISYYLMPQKTLVTKLEMTPLGKVEKVISGNYSTNNSVTFPKKKVKIGDSWPVESSSTKQGISIISKGTSTLKGITTYKGVKCAIIETKLNFTGTGQNLNMKVTGDGNGSAYISLENGITLFNRVHINLYFDMQGQKYSAISDTTLDIVK